MKKKTKKAKGQAKTLKEFRKILEECCKYGTKIDDDVLREMGNIIDGMVNFAGSIQQKIHQNQTNRMITAFNKRNKK